MRKLFLALILGSAFTSLTAQEMPQPSPMGTFMQRVGLTDVEVEYSRPSMKERTIFGELVAYDQVWRTGANASTKITFSTDVSVNGTAVKAGKYSFYTIPGKESWTLILNSNTSLWGVDGYSEDEDIVRVNVKPTTGAEVESMRITIDNVTENSADIVLSWEKTSVALPIKVDAKAQVKKNIDKALSDAHRAHRNAATYYADKGEFDTALEYIDLAIAINKGQSWYTQWMKAEILAESGDYKKALKQGEMAIAMGEEYYKNAGRDFSYKVNLDKNMEAWKAKK